MNFIIIGEAANRMSETIKNKLVDIDWRAISGFRNFIAHDYFGVDISIVWASIKNNLPEFRIALKELL